MEIRHSIRQLAATLILLSIASLGLFGCNPGRTQLPASTLTVETASQPTTLPAPLPTDTQEMQNTPTPTPSSMNLAHTSWKDFPIGDFQAVHAPVDPDANQHRIFGNLQVLPPAAGLSPDLAACLGRWEGQEIVPEGSVPSQIVLFVQQIDERGGQAYLWVGEQLQYPFYVKEISFRVVPGDPPSIEWQGDLTGAPGGKGKTGRFIFSYDHEGDLLRGGLSLPPNEKLVRNSELKRGSSSFIYRDFLKFLQSRRVTFHEYADPALQPFGWGYLAFLPEGYEENPGQSWPLLVFLIGTGERGKSAYLLARHGPLKEIVAGESLPFIVITPMLNDSPDFRSFPEAYLDGMLAEILAGYRVDRERIYLTGISMGGEATYRYALYRPELFAAISPMSAFEARFFPAGRREGFQSSNLPFERIKDIPMWVFHGSADGIIPLSVAWQTVDALIAAGAEVRFTVLEGQGHDAWTEVYADPELYEWLLEHSKP